MGAYNITRCSTALRTYWPPNRWDARNGFRGAGSAVVALCYQCPVWGVDPAIVVRPGVACRHCVRCLLLYMWCAGRCTAPSFCRCSLTLPLPAGMHSQVGRCLAFLVKGRAVWREAAGGYRWSEPAFQLPGHALHLIQYACLLAAIQSCLVPQLVVQARCWASKRLQMHTHRNRRTPGQRRCLTQRSCATITVSQKSCRQCSLPNGPEGA